MVKKKAPRKPRSLWLCSEFAACLWPPDYASLTAVHGKNEVGVAHSIYTPEECRKLAKWLCAHADWADYQAKKGRGKG